VIKRNSQILHLWFLICDLALTALAWVAAYYFRFEMDVLPQHVDAEASFEQCFHNIPLLLLLAGVAYHLTGQYVIHRFRRVREEVVSIVKGTMFMGLLVIATTYGLHDAQSRATIGVFLTLCPPLILMERRLNWLAIRWLRTHGFNQTQSIIVGTGRVARSTARSLRRASWMGISNVGFVEDHPTRWVSDLNVLGTTAELPEIIDRCRVTHVFIALPMNRYHEARRIYGILSQTFVDVRLVVDVPNLVSLTLTTTNMDGMPLIGLRESPYFGLNVLVKRGMDIALSLVTLLILSPLLAVIAVLVKLTSSGPIFYRQPRCGMNGETFDMIKFRSMRVDAEAKTGAVWAKKDDPRCTALGAILRKTSLDELPQLINVLKGDMSLVGPRPERPKLIEKFSKTIPNYNSRHCVKAGITGWAQVNGWRGNTSLRKRIQFDLYYITHWTPWLDVRIMWMTLWRGLIHRNAY
jgi:Undecaprenyl-phosphate glucose phosphotransferase